MDWVRGRGDANKLEDMIVKRMTDFEKHSEVCHNVLEKRIGHLNNHMDKVM